MTTVFMHDQLVLIVSPQDEWADAQHVNIDHIAGRVLLTREPGSALYATVERLLGEDRMAKVELILLAETEAIKRSVELGLGVAFIQKIAVEREIKQGTLHAIELSEVDVERTYLTALRKRYVPNEAVEAFLGLQPFHTPT
ncbi:MAG: LysR substrate-binding domain-containing protein [Anaerolineae bacterium]